MNICGRKMRGRDVSDSSMRKSRKNNGNVKRSPRIIVKKLTRREIAEFQSRSLGSCEDLTMATEILAEQNYTSDNLPNQQKVKDSGDSSALNNKSSNLIEESNERVNENPGSEEGNHIKNAVSSKSNSLKCDQTQNLTHGSPGHICNNVIEDLYDKMQEQENKSIPEVRSSVRECGTDAPNEKYKLPSKDQPSIHITNEGKMVAKVILKKLTEEDIAKYTQKPKSSQTAATEMEKLSVQSQKETAEQGEGAEKDTTMPEIDRLSSDSDFTDSEITFVTKKRKLRSHKKAIVESDSDAIVSDDDDYNIKEEIHKTSFCDSTDSEPEQVRTRAPSKKRGRLIETSDSESKEDIKKWKRGDQGSGVYKNEKMTINRTNDNTQKTLKQPGNASFIQNKTNVFRELSSFKRPLPASAADLCSSKKLSFSLLCSMYLYSLPTVNLYNLSKRGEFMLGILQEKISQISSKPLPMLMTQIQMKDRFLSTEFTMKKALEHKLEQHIALCRLNQLKVKLMKYLLEVKLVYGARTLPTSRKPRVTSNAASYGHGNYRLPSTASSVMSQRHASFANKPGFNFSPYMQYRPQQHQLHHAMQGSNYRFTRPPQRPRPSFRPVFTDTRQRFNSTAANQQRFAAPR